MKIGNEYANELLIEFRKGNKVQEFMDAVSGVEKYRIDDPSRQGCIRGMFSKELIKDQFLVNIDDVVSMFWCGVFEYVDRAMLWGEKVEIKKPGKEVQIRKTNNNPIHYLRYHGGRSVRNYITKLYRKNLQQSCLECGYVCSVNNDKICKNCKAEMQTTYKFVDINNDYDNLTRDESVKMVEDMDMGKYINNILDKFDKEILKEGRASQIFNILTKPDYSRDMCAACNLCPAETFDINSCTNYNANIGAYLGVNKTMVANKMRSIRKRLPQFLFSEGTNEANHIINILPKKYKALLPIVD